MALKYQMIKEFLKNSAAKSNPSIPSVRELMRQFGVSQSSVMRAVKELEYEGVLQCRQGSGITVASSGAGKRAPGIVEPGGNGELLFIYVDYFAESLWRVKSAFINYAMQERYRLLHYTIPRAPGEEEAIWKVASEKPYQGVVIQCGSRIFSAWMLKKLGSLSCPVVLMDSNYVYDACPPNFCMQMADAEACGRLCMETLVAQGHKTVAHIRNEPETDWVAGMAAGCRGAAKKAGVAFHYLSYAIRAGDDAIYAARKITQEKMDFIMANGVTGLVYTSGVGAFAAAALLQQKGLSIPKDMSVVACSDSFCANFCATPITIVDYDTNAMARDAIDVISGKKRKRKLLLYPPLEIRRASVGAPRAAAEGAASRCLAKP